MLGSSAVQLKKCCRRCLVHARQGLYVRVRSCLPHVRMQVPVMGPRPRLSLYSRQRIKILLRDGATIAEIVALKNEGILTCRQTVWRMKCHLETHNSIEPLPKSGRPTKGIYGPLRFMQRSSVVLALALALALA